MADLPIDIEKPERNADGRRHRWLAGFQSHRRMEALRIAQLAVGQLDVGQLDIEGLGRNHVEITRA